MLVTLVVLALFTATVWAGVDAALQPEWAWKVARIDRGVTTAILLFSCALGAGYYFALVRPRLQRAEEPRGGAGPTGRG